MYPTKWANLALLLAQPIQFGNMSTQNLAVISTAARTTDRLDHLKPGWTKNEHRSAKVIPENGTVEIELDRYKSRTHANQGDQVRLTRIYEPVMKVEFASNIAFL